MADYYVRWPSQGGGGGGSGTVTSVGLADGSSVPIYTVSGSPVTTAGTLTLTLNTEAANKVFAGPTSGGAAQPTFRSLVAGDLPAGTGSVTSVSVVTANGLAGSVANPTTTPAITLSTTITGVLQGNGTAISAATVGSLTDAGTDGITVTGGTNAVLGSGTSLSQHVADSTHNGYLSSVDWSTFNGKQAAGNYITALTGDVVATGPGSVAATLSDIVNKRYIDFLNGNDSGTGTIVQPWKTLQHAYNSISPSINEPYVFFLSGGNNDSDTAITAKPNVSLTADYPIQITPAFTISGGSTNDGCTFNNVTFVGAFSWVRNDNTAIAVSFNNCAFFSGPTIRQEGAGTCGAQCTNSTFVNSEWQLTNGGFGVFVGCNFLGTTTFDDPGASGISFLQFDGGYSSGALTIAGLYNPVYFTGFVHDVTFGASVAFVSGVGGFAAVEMDSNGLPATYTGTPSSVTLLSKTNYLDASGLTSGSVVFSNGSLLSQDNTNIFWDNSGKILTSGKGLKLNGSTSGTITQAAADATTSYSIKWPDAQGAASTVLTNDGAGNLSWAPASGGSGAVEVAVFNETQPNGVDGGTFTGGSWQTRTLNTTQFGQSWAALSGNQITLDAGTYYVEALAPCYRVNAALARFYNVTDSVDVILGQTDDVVNAAGVATSCQSHLMGTFTIASPKTFELQHIAQTTFASFGFGVGNLSGEQNVFSTVSITRASAASPPPSVVGPTVAVFNESQPSGTNGGTFTSGAWQTRTINSAQSPQVWASLSANQITLTAGTYCFEIFAPALQVSNHQAMLWNVTDSTTSLSGMPSYSSVATTDVTTSYVSGTLTIAGTKTFEVQHQCSLTSTGTGFGAAANFGINEIYTTVAITKLA